MCYDLEDWPRLARLAGVVLVTLMVAACGALVSSAPSRGTGSTTVTQPYPTPKGGTPLYAATLAAPMPGWASGPTCTFANGGLTVQPAEGLAYICLAPTASITDFAATVTVQQLSGVPTHAFGLAFRHAASHTYDFFGIDGRGRFTVTVVINDVSQTIIPFTTQTAIHVSASASNQLGVTMQGNTATFFINATAVGQATLPAFANGGVGLRGVNDGAVVFTQLTIAAL